LDGRGGITIGDNVLIGPNCVIASCEHSFGDPRVPICQQPVKYAAITIGNDVWIGEGVSIAGGLTIGDGCIIGAKSMVTRDCVPYGVYVGTPAKLIRMRFPELVVEQLLEIKWWEWPLAKIRASAAFFETDLCTYVGDLQDLIRPEPIAA
jgi:acetyltransferase-like isoleucine patch superfamily enzyme